MKKGIVILLLAASLGIMITGCGKDGADGLAFLAIDWVFTPQSYWDNNAGIPSPFTQGTYYQVSPGTYNFEYTAWDYTYYSGTYTLTINKGKKGSFLQDGKDGEDKYYTLWLYSDGPELATAKAAAGEEEQKGRAEGLTPSKAVRMEKSAVSDGEYETEGPVYRIEQHKGNTTLVIEYQKGSRR
jgi:major membrane immunogen (membrane-anchored lipoprotein)